MSNSLEVLSESLDRKIEVLHEIEAYNERQRQAFDEEEPDMSSFDEAIKQKGELIEKLEKLDEGFELLYRDLCGELKCNREKYAGQIRELQEKITIITELSVSIQATEARNKKLIEQYFARERNSIKKGRLGSKAAFDYYKNMAGLNVPAHSILDSKQ